MLPRHHAGECSQVATIHKFPPFDRDLDDGDSNVVSILNAKPLPCDFDSRPDPYAGLEEAARRAAVEADSRRDLRIMRWQSRVKWFAVLTAYAAIIYFALQLGRGQ
jgi:hypothetical protein